MGIADDIVDYEGKGRHEPREHNDVERFSKQAECENSGHDGHRQHRECNQNRPPLKEEQPEGQGDDDERNEPSDFEVVEAAANGGSRPEYGGVKLYARHTRP